MQFLQPAGVDLLSPNQRSNETFLLIVALGCSSTIHREFSVDGKPASSLSIDAKQRVILVTTKGGKDGQQHVVCAEPSPDVFAAIAATAAAEAKVGEEGGKLATAVAEDATTIGDRTQTVQLLRDALYRGCEAYMNGAIGEKEYGRMLVGFDEMMITLLAIDGLTHRTQSPRILSHGDTSATAGGSSGSSGSVAAGSGSAGSTAPDVADSKLAAEIHEILKSYYKFQLDVKKLYKEEK